MSKLLNVMRESAATKRREAFARYLEILEKADAANDEDLRQLAVLMRELNLSESDLDRHEKAVASRKRLRALKAKAPELESAATAARKAHSDARDEMERKVREMQSRVAALQYDMGNADRASLDANRASNAILDEESFEWELFGKNPPPPPLSTRPLNTISGGAGFAPRQLRPLPPGGDGPRAA